MASKKLRKTDVQYLQFHFSKRYAFFFSLTIVCFEICASLKHKSLAYLINGAITIALLFPKDVDTTPGGGGARELNFDGGPKNGRFLASRHSGRWKITVFSRNMEKYIKGVSVDFLSFYFNCKNDDYTLNSPPIQNR